MVKFIILMICLLISNLLFAAEQSIPEKQERQEGPDKHEQAKTKDCHTCPADNRSSANITIELPKQDGSPARESDHSNKESWNAWTALSTSIMTLFTGGLIVVGFLQWLTYRDTLAVNKAIQRAYIHFDHVHLSQERIPLPQGAGVIDMTCYFNNFGLTQGTLTTGYVDKIIDRDTPPVPDYPNHPNIWSGTETVPPKGEAIFPIPIALETTEIESIRSGSFFFIYGYFTYRDIFNEKREIAFFTQYDPNKERFFKVHRPGYNYST